MKGLKRLPRILSLTAATRHYGEILDRVRNGKEKFVVHGRGSTGAVVIMSVGEYLSSMAEANSRPRMIRSEAEAIDLHGWSMQDIRREIAEYRRKSRALRAHSR